MSKNILQQLENLPCRVGKKCLLFASGCVTRFRLGQVKTIWVGTCWDPPKLAGKVLRASPLGESCPNMVRDGHIKKWVLVRGYSKSGCLGKVG